MTVIEKAKELGSEIKNTREYIDLERASQNIKDDPAASKIIEGINELQERISFAQNSGVQPSQEDMDSFNDLKNKMDSNLTIIGFIKAQENFSQIMQEINSAISEGIGAE